MSIQRTPMTRGGFERLREEVDRLKKERPNIVRAIAEARAHGDLSENAEYHAARERQGFIEARITDLESKIGTAEVIDPPTSGDRVTFGSTVKLTDEDGKETTYQIVGSDEAEPKQGLISVMSPLARTLIGKKVGDSVEVPAPGGARVSGHHDGRPYFALFDGYAADPGHLNASGAQRVAAAWLAAVAKASSR